MISRHVVNASPRIFQTEIGLLEVLRQCPLGQTTGVGPCCSSCAGTAQAGGDVYVRSAGGSHPYRSGRVTVRKKATRTTPLDGAEV